MIGPLSGGLTPDIGQLKRSGADGPEDLKRVASEFEALLVGQLLKSVRESSSGGWMGGEGENGTLMVEVAEQQLARQIALQGGMGLADLIVEGLSKESPKVR
jgi:peptidoglycan hydrolase FlgJ